MLKQINSAQGEVSSRAALAKENGPRYTHHDFLSCEEGGSTRAPFSAAISTNACGSTGLPSPKESM